MGREANCQCRWAGEAASCKVLLETHELIVRGPIRRRALISSLTHVSVEGGQLLFRVEGQDVVLSLGSGLAQRWAKAIATPPPSLATKLGISSASRLLVMGELEARELKTAIAEAVTAEGKEVTLILAIVKTMKDLNYMLNSYSAYPSNPPIWIIYAKGPNKVLTESEIRNTLRHEGFIDTKVASVSSTLTALRFIKRN
jgi:hypothetical protein